MATELPHRMCGAARSVAPRSAPCALPSPVCSEHDVDHGGGGARAAPDRARLPALLGPARGAFSQLLPELAGRIGVVAAPSVRRGPPSQVHLFELTLGTVERLTRDHLLVVALEDLHWADESSRDLLGFL